MTIDEVRKLDTHRAILFIRGEDPVLDKKYNIKRHPNIKLTTDGSGIVSVRDQALGNSRDFPENMGVLINSPGFINLDTGLQNLRYLAGIRGVIGDQEIRDAMKKVGLDPEDRTKVEHYSLGMKQKLGLAQAIMEGQDILVLDEPFNALDYKTYNDVKEIIRTLHAEGKTILMTSHNYEDIETLCDEIYAIEDGQLGTLPADEMKRRFRG